MPRVLIVEDEWLIGYTLRDALERQGHEVVDTVANAEAAYDLCRTERPDVILMDIRLGRASGVEATRHIMESCPTCVIMVTACKQEDSLAAAEAAGAMGYVLKPVMPEDLIEQMKAAQERFEQFQRVHERVASLDEALETLHQDAGVGHPCHPPE